MDRREAVFLFARPFPECLLLAQSRHRLSALHMSAFDPKRTSMRCSIELSIFEKCDGAANMKCR